MKSIIGIVKSDYKDARQSLERAIALTNSFPISSNDKVVIKINMCGARTPETGAITHPLFLDALLCYLRERFENLEIFVVESDATTVLANPFIKWLGCLPVLQKWNTQWVNLSNQRIINKKTTADT